MRRFLAYALSLFAILIFSGSHESAVAHDRTKPVVSGDLKIEKIWTRATPGPNTDNAGYVMISNSGTIADRLIAAETSIAQSIAFHMAGSEDGAATMLPLTSGIEIPGGGRAVLRPGRGHPHLMFISPRRPIKAGAKFKVTLVFERAGRVDVNFRTIAIGANPGHAGH